MTPTHPERVRPDARIAGIVGLFADPPISEAQMGKSTYEIRVAGTVPLELLENFRQIETVEPAGTILHAVEWTTPVFGVLSTRCGTPVST